MATIPAPDTRPLLPGMRRLLVVAGVLVCIVGVQLFVLTEQTERFFAWTVAPHLTAATLGAAYWSSCVLEWGAARERTWARARLAVPAVLLFTALTFAVTLVHLDRFHLRPPARPETMALTWVWIAIYAGVPVVMAALLLAQRRAPGPDPAGSAPLPGPLRAVLVAQAATLLLVGLALLLATTATIPRWPWALTPLTAQALGAWLLGLGLAAAHLALEGDLERGRVAFRSCAAFGALELLALARYPRDLDWGTWGGRLYALFILGLLAMGLYGWLAAPARARLSARASSSPGAPGQP